MTKPTLRKLTGEELAKNLEIDDDRQLYWQGKRIKSQITLNWPQTISAAIVVVAGVATIFNGFSSGLNSLSTFMCNRGWEFPIGGCGSQKEQAPAGSSVAQPGTTPGK